jgi:hypothetical protein
MKEVRSEYGATEDVAIWLNRRIVAAIRWGTDGQPSPTIF